MHPNWLLCPPSAARCAPWLAAGDVAAAICTISLLACGSRILFYGTSGWSAQRGGVLNVADQDQGSCAGPTPDPQASGLERSQLSAACTRPTQHAGRRSGVTSLLPLLRQVPTARP